jgi:hypothetical protein
MEFEIEAAGGGMTDDSEKSLQQINIFLLI